MPSYFLFSLASPLGAPSFPALDSVDSLLGILKSSKALKGSVGGAFLVRILIAFSMYSAVFVLFFKLVSMLNPHAIKAVRDDPGVLISHGISKIIGRFFFFCFTTILLWTLLLWTPFSQVKNFFLDIFDGNALA